MSGTGRRRFTILALTDDYVANTPPIALASCYGVQWRVVGRANRGQRRHYGRNGIVEAPRSELLDILRDTVGDPMIWFLIGTSALYAFLAQYVESLMPLAAVVPLMDIDTFLHRQTQASTDILHSRLATQAAVIRQDTTRTVPVDELVPGIGAATLARISHR